MHILHERPVFYWCKFQNRKPSARIGFERFCGHDSKLMI